MGQTAEDRVLSRHLEEAKREEEAKKTRGIGKGRKLRMEHTQMRENETDEQVLLKHLLEDKCEERSGVEQKTEREQEEKKKMQKERSQSKAKAAVEMAVKELVGTRRVLSKAKAAVDTVARVQEDKIGRKQKETDAESGEILKAEREDGGKAHE